MLRYTPLQYQQEGKLFMSEGYQKFLLVLAFENFLPTHS